MTQLVLEPHLIVELVYRLRMWEIVFELLHTGHRLPAYLTGFYYARGSAHSSHSLKLFFSKHVSSFCGCVYTQGYQIAIFVGVASAHCQKSLVASVFC